MCPIKDGRLLPGSFGEVHFPRGDQRAESHHPGQCDVVSPGGPAGGRRRQRRQSAPAARSPLATTTARRWKSWGVGSRRSLIVNPADSLEEGQQVKWSLRRTREASRHEAADLWRQSSSPPACWRDARWDRTIIVRRCRRRPAYKTEGAVARCRAQGLDSQGRVVGDLSTTPSSTSYEQQLLTANQSLGGAKGSARTGALAGTGRVGGILPDVQHRSQRLAPKVFGQSSRRS